MKVLNTRTDYGDCDSAMKALHRWTLTITTITLASAGQHWTGTPWFADGTGGPDEALETTHTPKKLHLQLWYLSSRAS